MKKLAVILLLAGSIFRVQAQNPTPVQQAVQQVVLDAYVNGIHNGGTSEAIRKGFHPSFNMLRLMDNEIKPMPIEEWIANLEKNRAANPNGTVVKTDATFLSIDVTGNAAVVKLELARNGKTTFTDYISLYKFTEGWRIVSKTFHRH